MTIKELAEFTGREVRTVRRWIAKAGDKVSQPPSDIMSQGIPHDYSVEDVAHILNNSSMSKDAVSILMDNAMNKNTPTTQVVDYEIIGEMIGMAVSAAMTPIVQELKQINSQPQLQIAAPKEDYFSLLAYCSIHEIKTNRSELALHGRELRKMTLNKNLTLKKIPDERWGHVNSYPVEILDEYFRV